MACGSFRWQNIKSMPTKRVFSTPVIYEDCLYVIGGCDEKGSPLNSFEMFDFTAKENKWVKLAPMPTKRAGAGAAGLKGKIVVVGGVSAAQKPLDMVELYDIKEKKWKTADPLIEPLLGMSVLVKDDRLLVLGGMGQDSNPHEYFSELNIDTEPYKWKQLPDMLTPRYATFSFHIGTSLYVIGGRQGKLPTDAFEVFDFEQRKWSKLDPVPSKRVFPIYVTDNTRIYSLGGLQQQPTVEFTDKCEIYDIEKKKWKVGPPMPTKRGDLAAGVVGGRVICVGGLGIMGKPLDTVEAYDPENNQWSTVSKVPTTHCSCACIMFRDRLYVIGGLSLCGPSNCMEALGFS